MVPHQIKRGPEGPGPWDQFNPYRHKVELHGRKQALLQGKQKKSCLEFTRSLLGENVVWTQRRSSPENAVPTVNHGAHQLGLGNWSEVKEPWMTQNPGKLVSVFQRSEALSTTMTCSVLLKRDWSGFRRNISMCQEGLIRVPRVYGVTYRLVHTSRPVDPGGQKHPFVLIHSLKFRNI